MALGQISRAIMKIFGRDAGSSEFGQFGSNAASPPGTTTKDITTIQELDEYLAGWMAATADASEPPRLEDRNGLDYLFSTQLAYLFQSGIPEWLDDENQRYYAGVSICLRSGAIYVAVTGDDTTTINSQIDPATDDGTNWTMILSLDGAVNLTGAQTVAGIKTFSSIPVLPSSDPTEDDQAVRKAYVDSLMTSVEMPIGFTYIQFPDEDDPATLGLIGTWTNVSTEIAGDFIRFEGGDAETFESGEQAHQFQGHQHQGYNGNGTSGTRPNLGTNSSVAYTIDSSYPMTPITLSEYGTVSFGTETRPVNITVRKWRRTA